MKTIVMLTAFAGAVALSACAPTHDAAPGAEPTPVACKAGDYQPQSLDQSRRRPARPHLPRPVQQLRGDHGLSR